MAKINIDSAPGTGGGGGGGNLQLLSGASMSSTLTAVTDTSNTQSPLKLSTTAVQVVSPLRVTTDDPSDMYLDLEDGSANNRFNITRNTASQQVNLNFASNPGGSTTVVGAIRTYVDGVNLSEVMAFREDGNVGIGTTTPVAKLQVNGVTALSNADLTGYNLYSPFNIVRNGATSMAMDRYTGAPHFNFRAAGGTIASPSTQVGELGKIDFWSYSGTSFNQNVRLIAQAENFVGGLAQTQRLSIGMGQTGGGIDYYYEMVNGNSYFGASAFGTTPTARVQVVGSGSTSATTSLLVQNSSGNTSLQVTDDQQVTGYSGTQIRFKLGVTSLGQGVSTRDGEFAVGLLDASGASLRLLTTTTGFSYIDGYTEGASKASNYPIVIGSRANNTGISVTGTTTQENGSQTIFGYAVNEASSLVTINSTTRGFLPPRMTDAQIRAIATPAEGLVAYNTTISHLCVYQAGAWVKLSHTPM